VSADAVVGYAPPLGLQSRDAVPGTRDSEKLALG